MERQAVIDIMYEERRKAKVKDKKHTNMEEICFSFDLFI